MAEPAKKQTVFEATEATAPTYTLPNGEVIELTPIPPLVLNTIQSDNSDRPNPPTVERKVGRKGKSVYEPDYDNPGYQAAVANYNAAQYERLLQAAFTLGIASAPPKAKALVKVTTLMFGEDYTDDQYKYAWIASNLTTQEQYEDLLDAILSLTVVTEKGLAESDKTFPAND